MKNRIEVEEKYFVGNLKLLEEIAISQQFKLDNSYIENDEYFTDIESKYIKNRTCLRLRNTDNKTLELTFKGKSNDFQENGYAKLERNIDLEIEQYDDVVEMLKNLGYYSYTIVNKNRKVYTKIVDKLNYNIMIDDIKGVGTFVEFEILSSNLNDSISEIKEKLNKFIEYFESVGLEEAKLPYRDFVANHLFSCINPNNMLTTIFLGINDVSSKSKNNEEVNINILLIKKLKEKGIRFGLVSNSSKNDLAFLIEKLDVKDLFEVVISREDLENLKQDSGLYILAMKKMKVSPNECVVIEDSLKGLKAAQEANILAVKTNEHSGENKELNKCITIEKISRLFLNIINNM